MRKNLSRTLALTLFNHDPCDLLVAVSSQMPIGVILGTSPRPLCALASPAPGQLPPGPVLPPLLRLLGVPRLQPPGSATCLVIVVSSSSSSGIPATCWLPPSRARNFFLSGSSPHGRSRSLTVIGDGREHEDGWAASGVGNELVDGGCSSICVPYLRRLWLLGRPPKGGLATFSLCSSA